MSQLVTKKIYATPPPVAVIPVDFVKPLSYEFRVAEVMDAEGKIKQVRLQVQIWEHDEFGSGVLKQRWTDVPRVLVDSNGTVL